MRRSTQKRQTKETNIEIALDLDAGASSIAVPNGFFGHMLEALAVHHRTRSASAPQTQDQLQSASQASLRPASTRRCCRARRQPPR